MTYLEGQPVNDEVDGEGHVPDLTVSLCLLPFGKEPSCQRPHIGQGTDLAEELPNRDEMVVRTGEKQKVLGNLAGDRLCRHALRPAEEVVWIARAADMHAVRNAPVREFV